MKRISVLFIMLLVSVVFQKQALAQATRTWVSGVGDDVNPCSRTAPCKTFAGAISKTAPGGEINIIDPAGFGAVTITKSITIDGAGALGGILASSTNGIVINAGVNDVVILRNLSINGGPPNLPGINGIRYIAGKRVIVEDCDIFNFGTNHILVELTNKGVLTVKNTTISSYNAAVTGININSSADTAIVVLDNVKIQGIGTAVYARNRARVSVFNSMISNNIRAVFAEFNTSTVYLSNTSLISNTGSIQLGIEAIKPRVFSFGNNQIIPAPGVGVLSFISSK
jgi:hypothetical protein